MSPSVGTLLHAFLVDELPIQKGLRPASIKAYRDGLRLFLAFVAKDLSCRLTQISYDAFTLEKRDGQANRLVETLGPESRRAKAAGQKK